MKEHFISKLWQPSLCCVSHVQKNEWVLWLPFWKVNETSIFLKALLPNITMRISSQHVNEKSTNSHLQHPYPASPFIKKSTSPGSRTQGGWHWSRKKKSKFLVSLKIAGICLPRITSSKYQKTAMHARLSSKKKKFLKKWPIELQHRTQEFSKCGSCFNDQFHKSRRGKWEIRSY